MIFLAFFFPLAVYLLLLGFINRHRHPLIVSGVWDGIGLIFGVCGFLLLAGPAVLSTLSERWRLFWLLGRSDVPLAAGEGGWPMWTFLAFLYFLLIISGAAWYLWRQRCLTSIYNTNADTIERTVMDICKEMGINPMRSGNLFLFGSWPDSVLSRGPGEAEPLPSDAITLSRALGAKDPLPGRGPDYVREQPAILEVDCFSLMHHVTLRWEPADTPLRRLVEAELARRLAETLADDSLLGSWLLTLGFTLLSFNLAGAFFLVLLNLRLFLR